MTRMKHAIAAVLLLTAGTMAAQAATCDALSAAKITDGTILSAQLVEAGKYPAPAEMQPAQKALLAKLPAFCRIEAKLTPSADSDIRIEVWMPAAGWNGKLVEGGNAAFSPALSYATMAQALKAGFAATSSNTGHEENNAKFAMDHPEKLIDFGYRAVHVNIVAAKQIVAAYYGTAARKAYFQGCSTGGRQGYGEAQRYPEDFDGIVAGAPGINFTHQTGAELWNVTQVHNNPAMMMSQEKLMTLHNAVLAACDKLDGVEDGVIENPLRCDFKPEMLLCKGEDNAKCLTAPQLDLVKKLYSGPTGASGELIFPGLAPGSEWGWGFLHIRTEPLEYGLDAYRIVIKRDMNWDFRTLDFGRDTTEADRTVGKIVNNYDANLKPFFAHGGKLLGFHGWSDPQTTPLSSIAYYKLVAKEVGGEAKLDNAYRLFLIPGLGHCGESGNEGVNTFNLLTAIDAWSETGKPPAVLTAARVSDGVLEQTHPICPFPQEAVYNGSGNAKEAASYTCAVK